MERTSAMILAAVLFMVFAVLHFYFGWETFVDTQASHGESALLGSYLWEYTSKLFEGLTAEMFELALQFAIIGGLFTFIGVKAYETDAEEIKERLNKLEGRHDNDMSDM